MNPSVFDESVSEQQWTSLNNWIVSFTWFVELGGPRWVGKEWPRNLFSFGRLYVLLKSWMTILVICPFPAMKRQNVCLSLSFFFYFFYTDLPPTPAGSLAAFPSFISKVEIQIASLCLDPLLNKKQLRCKALAPGQCYKQCAATTEFHWCDYMCSWNCCSSFVARDSFVKGQPVFLKLWWFKHIRTDFTDVLLYPIVNTYHKILK